MTRQFDLQWLLPHYPLLLHYAVGKGRPPVTGLPFGVVTGDDPLLPLLPELPALELCSVMGTLLTEAAVTAILPAP